MGEEAQRIVGIAIRGFSLFLKNLGIKEVCEVDEVKEVLDKCSLLLGKSNYILVIQESLLTEEVKIKISSSPKQLVVTVPDSLIKLKRDPKKLYEDFLAKVIGFRVKIPE